MSSPRWAAVRRSRSHLLAIAAVMLGANSVAAGPTAGADLGQPVTATWNGIGLREWAGRIGETAGVPVLVDRRVDPETALRLDCRNEPLRDVLDRGAATAGAEVAALRSSIRIVPRGLASVIVRAEQARESRVASLPTRQRAVLDKPTRWQWAAGARPGDLVAEAARKAGVELEDVAAVPHDHLPAMPPAELTLAEGLDMLLATFDMRIEWQTVGVAGESETNPTRTNPTRDGGGPAARVPRGRIVAIGTGTVPAADTAAEGTAPKGKPAAAKPSRRPPPVRPKPPANTSTFSLQVAAPLEELLTAVAARLNLELDVDRESLTRRGIAPAEIVRTTVKDASRDELLDAILDPLELDWNIDGKTLRVFAR